MAVGLAVTPRLRALPYCAECGRIALGPDDGGEARMASVSELRPAPRGVRMARRTLVFHPECLAVRRAWHRARAGGQLWLTLLFTAALVALTWMFHMSPLLALPVAALGAYAAAIEWRGVKEVRQAPGGGRNSSWALRRPGGRARS